MPVEQQPPDVIAMILADGVHHDGATGKFFILGTYSAIYVPEFPWPHPNVVAYLALTDGRGETELEMRLIDVDEVREPIFSSTATITLDPIGVREVVFESGPVAFPEPGEYRLQLLASGDVLRERRIFVVPIDNPENHEEA